MEKNVTLGWLLDFYGPLLTAHRREILRLYCEEDCSLTEIADALGITRQGVHDALRAAEAQLAAYEEKLGLMARYRRVRAQIDTCIQQLQDVRATEVTAPSLEAAIDCLRTVEW